MKKNVILEFGDSGCGIDENIIQDIFKSHFTTKEKDKGTGIGLHMSKMIVEDKLDGKIIASNKKFKYKDKAFTGACFKITLPRII